MNEEILNKYFNLTISDDSLFKKAGEIESGKHGVSIINGEHYASHYHLVKSIAIGELLEQIKDLKDKDFKALATKQNEDFNSWPKVVYKNGQGLFQKYSYTWLVKEFVYSKNSFAEIIDFCKIEISKEAGGIMEQLVERSDVYPSPKYNLARKLFEELGDNLINRNYMPSEMKNTCRKRYSHLQAMSYFFNGGDYSKLGYKLKTESCFPDFIIKQIQFIQSCGNSGSHKNDAFNNYIANNEHPYLRNALVYSALAVFTYIKQYYENGMPTNNWERK